MIIALHGDYANADMLKRDVGDFAPLVNCFWDASGWRPAKREIGKLERYIKSLPEPPTLIGYSRGGSIIAMLSNKYPIRAAVLYESPVLDSFTVGGTFPVLQIWNDQGVMAMKRRAGQARVAQEVWKRNHPVETAWGVGTHIRRDPIGHGWDVGLNDRIRDWLLAC